MSRSLMLVDDILRHIDDIRDFITGLTEADFLADKKTKAAIALGTKSCAAEISWHMVMKLSITRSSGKSYVFISRNWKSR